MITFWGRSLCDQWGMDAKQDHDALYIIMGRWNQVIPKTKNGSNEEL
jgi:hypothetical protein